jgi:hypothetical protein
MRKLETDRRVKMDDGRKKKVRRCEDGKLGGNGILNWECGLRPIGAYAYAPAGMRN